MTVGPACCSERREEVDDDLYHFQAKAGLTSLLLIRGGEDIKASRVIISLTSSRESPSGHGMSSLPGYYKAGKCCINHNHEDPLPCTGLRKVIRYYRRLIRYNGGSTWVIRVIIIISLP